MKQKNKVSFFETPKNKLRAFQSPRLIMYSEGQEVGSWSNTQPLYFYPFSWLDYLNGTGIREVYVIDSSTNTIREVLNQLRDGKVHFENPNIEAIKIARDLGHKVSVICNLNELNPLHISALAETDFVRVRVNKQEDLAFLSGLPNEGLLSCIKVYAGEGCDYQAIVLQSREMGFDFIHVAKRLINCQENPELSSEEAREIRKLSELETEKFRVILPKSLKKRFAERFRIDPSLGNAPSCGFSKYRSVLKEDSLYPCYTKSILARPSESGKPKSCLDCACIYENDMLHSIKREMQRYKEPSFALEYMKNGR